MSDMKVLSITELRGNGVTSLHCEVSLVSQLCRSLHPGCKNPSSDQCYTSPVNSIMLKRLYLVSLTKIYRFFLLIIVVIFSAWTERSSRACYQGEQY